MNAPFPRDMISQYGNPILTNRASVPVGGVVIGSSMDRWSLAILSAGGAEVIPVVGGDVGTQTINITNGNPLILTILQDGLLTTVEWRNAGGVPNDFTVIECFAFKRSEPLITNVFANNPSLRKARTPWSDYYRKLRRG